MVSPYGGPSKGSLTDCGLCVMFTDAGNGYVNSGEISPQNFASLSPLLKLPLNDSAP